MFKRISLAGLVLALLLTIVGHVIAQDATPASCSADSITALVASIQDANGAALTAIKAGDTQTAIDALSDATERVGLMKAVCAGLSFEDTKAKVLGPVELAEGMYKVTATTAGFMTVELKPTEGSCGETIGDTVMPVFGLFKDQANDGSEVLIPSDGCKTFIQVSNITDPWTLTFEKVG